jgi:dynein heavy chain 1, cytosolic
LKDGKITDTEEELYKTFTYNVQRNLHVVFTMNPSNPDFSNRTASSPALFNRCVIDWFGEWSTDGLLQVAKEFTKTLDILPESFQKKMDMYQKTTDEGRIVMVDPKHDALCQCIVDMHLAVRDVNNKLSKSAKRFNYITPRDFLDFIKHFVELLHEKKEELEE